MAERFRAYSAVLPIILITDGAKTQILLHRRKNTGYQDGRWDFAGSGHIDEGETARAAAVRECEEELGIHIKEEDLTFSHLSHHFGNRTYYDICFLIKQFEGTPAIMEPEKCSELGWFDIDHLPDEMIEVRRTLFQRIMENVLYSEIFE